MIRQDAGGVRTARAERLNGTAPAGRPRTGSGKPMSLKFRVELVWKDADDRVAESIYLTSDGRVILQGRPVSPAERQALSLPEEAGLISVDRRLIRAIKDML
jgi:hypothetical protein